MKHPQSLRPKIVATQKLLPDTHQNLISSGSSLDKHILKTLWKSMHRLRLWNAYRFKDPKLLNTLPGQQLLPDTHQNPISSWSSLDEHILKTATATAVARYPQNLISSTSSLGKHILKICWKSIYGFRLWNTHKFYASQHSLDSAGDDYNHSLYGLLLTNTDHRTFQPIFNNQTVKYYVELL